MSAPTLNEYLSKLREQDILVDVNVSVDPIVELPEVSAKIQDELQQAGLFTHPRDFADWSIARNIIADRRRALSAFNVEGSDIVGVLCDRLKVHRDIHETEAGDSASEDGYQALDPSFAKIPLQGISSVDKTRSIEAAIALTIDPETGAVCAGLTRHQIVDSKNATVSDLSRNLERVRQRYTAQSSDMPLLLILSAHPAYYLAAQICNDLEADFFEMAASLLDHQIAVLKSEGGILFPIDCGIVLEGAIASARWHLEQPSIDITGLQRDGRNVPVFILKRLWRRRDAVYVSASSGDGASDVAQLQALATEIVLWRHIDNVEGGIDLLDIRCHPSTGNNVVVVKFRPKLGGQSKTVLMAALSSPSIRPKIVVGVDEDVDAGDLRDVIWSIASRTHAQHDVAVLKNFMAPATDLTAQTVFGQDDMARLGSKFFIDSTMAPLSQTERRATFERAMPKNLNEVKLADYLR